MDPHKIVLCMNRKSYAILIRHAGACCIVIKRLRWVSNAIYAFKLCIIQASMDEKHKKMRFSLNEKKVFFHFDPHILE